MGIFQRLFQSSAQLNPSATNKRQTANVEQRLNELAREINQPFSCPQVKDNRFSVSTNKIKQWGQKAAFTSMLIALPLGLLWIVNLPYPAIRRPIYNRFPLLLLPSQIYFDNSYKQSVRYVRQGDQLVAQATSIEDIQLGQERLAKAQKHLDAIPFMPLEELKNSGYGYGRFYGSFSHFDMQKLRADVGTLEAKIFQEQNAYNLLQESLLDIKEAKSKYQQTNEASEQKTAIQAWQSAINRLREVPETTRAGKQAQLQSQNATETFSQEVGEIFVAQELQTYILSAQQFAQQAQNLAKNAPHSLEKWQEIERLWSLAIAELESVPQDDLQAYLKSKQLIAQYEGILAQIRLQKKDEQLSINAFNNAQQKIDRLLYNTSFSSKSLNFNQTIADLRNIVNELDKVKNETTVYNKSQELKAFANNKIQELQGTK